MSEPVIRPDYDGEYGESEEYEEEPEKKVKETIDLSKYPDKPRDAHGNIDTEKTMADITAHLRDDKPYDFPLSKVFGEKLGNYLNEVNGLIRAYNVFIDAIQLTETLCPRDGKTPMITMRKADMIEFSHYTKNMVDKINEILPSLALLISESNQLIQKKTKETLEFSETFQKTSAFLSAYQKLAEAQAKTIEQQKDQIETLQTHIKPNFKAQVKIPEQQEPNYNTTFR